MSNPFNPESRKYKIYAAFLEGGPEAAKAANAALSDPVAATTMNTWLSNWRRGVMRRTNEAGRRTTDAMRDAGMRLTGAVRVPGRAELYTLPDGKMVKMRTNIDRALMAYPSTFEDPFDFVLIVMPVERRSLAKGIEAYLVPVDTVRETLATARADWLRTGPNTTIANTLDVLPFDRRQGWVESAIDWATKWAAYRVPGVDMPAAATDGPNYSPGGDAQCIHRVALEKYGSLLAMFEHHGWPERGSEMMRKVQTRVVEHYGSVRAFESAHSDATRQYRIVVDQELYTAPSVDGLVTAWRRNNMWAQAQTNPDYMREIAGRAPLTFGHTIRTDTAINFLEDLAAEGVITIIKREIVGE